MIHFKNIIPIYKDMKNSRNPKNYTRKNFHALDPFGLPAKRSFVLPGKLIYILYIIYISRIVDK